MLRIKEYSKVDEHGFWIDTIRLKFDSSSILSPAPEGYFEANRPEGFRLPKWENSGWIEGATQEEIEQEENQPTTLDKIKQENEMLKERLDTAENAIISVMDFV